MDGSMTIQGTELEGQDGSILESHLSPRMASSRASDIQASLQELTPPMMVESEVMGEEEGWAEEGSGLGSHMMGSGLQEEGEEEGAEYRYVWGRYGYAAKQIIETVWVLCNWP